MSRDLCKECNKRPVEIAYKNKAGKIYYRDICWKCRSLNNPNYNQHYKNYQKKLKEEVLNAYGNQCECCKENNPLFLTIDHINGEGNKHRKIVGSGGYKMYRWIKKNNFPKEFRILCFNCNCGRQLNNGICPHKNKC